MEKYGEIIKKKDDGVTINLFVTPGAKKCVFPAGINDFRKCVEMKVKSQAKSNLANMEVLRTIAEFCNKPFSKVILVAGAKKREKIVLIKKGKITEIIKKLEASLNGL